MFLSSAGSKPLGDVFAFLSKVTLFLSLGEMFSNSSASDLIFVLGRVKVLVTLFLSLGEMFSHLSASDLIFALGKVLGRDVLTSHSTEVVEGLQRLKSPLTPNWKRSCWIWVENEGTK